jgi:hypothetical protein
VKDLAGDGYGDLGEPLADGVLDAAVPGSPMKVHVLHQVDASDHGDADLPVRGKHEVLFGQGVGAADLGGLLTQQRGIHRQLSLPLQRGALQIDLTGERHVPVQGPEILVLEVKGLPGLVVDDRSIGIDDPNRVGAGVGQVSPRGDCATG